MNIELITLLINRLILKAYPGTIGMYGFYSVLEETDPPYVDQLDRIDWIHGEMTKPTQAELDAENLLYEEYLLGEKVRPAVMIILNRIDDTLSYHPVWNHGQHYDDVKWTDELQNEANESRRSYLQDQLSDLASEKSIKETRRDEILVIPVGDRTEAEQAEFDQLESEITAIEQKVVDTQAAHDAIVDVIVDTSVRPSWDDVKAEFAVYEAELEAARLQRDQEESEYADMDVDAVLAALLGNDVMYAKKGKHFDDVEIRSGHAKPTWADMKTKWAELSAARTAEADKKSKKALGQAARKCCTEVLDLVAGLNITKELTSEQIDLMTVTWGDILTALQNNRPTTAKGLVEAMVPDGTLVTQADKDAVLEEFAEHGI